MLRNQTTHVCKQHLQPHRCVYQSPFPYLCVWSLNLFPHGKTAARMAVNQIMSKATSYQPPNVI